MEIQDRCLYGIGIEKRLARGGSPENPFLDCDCLSCYNSLEKQSAILCVHYFSAKHMEDFRKLFQLGFVKGGQNE